VVAGVATVDSITNPDKMFEDAGIKVVLGKIVQGDAVNKTLMLADGGTIHFDKLILAMGPVRWSRRWKAAPSKAFLP
jgi:NADH dehydrogenase FAD-containing subunit